MMDSNLVVMETTNGIINEYFFLIKLINMVIIKMIVKKSDLYDLISPKSLLSWQRMRIAN